MKTEKRVAKPGEKIVLTRPFFDFDREGDVLAIDGADPTPYVLGKHHVRDTGIVGGRKWYYDEGEYEVIVDERIYPEPERTEYERNIIALMDRQREKGLRKYGEILEDNTTLTSVQRIDHASEEGIDKLMYLQHLRKALLDRMTVNDYQRAALRTAGDYESKMDQLRNALYGLCGESGECIDLLKKHEFQGHELDRDHLIEELGDVAWYLPLAADALGVTLEEVLSRNVEKLKARYPDGFDKARSINRNENKD